jgi:ribulose-phosphate 3-epimerase
MNHLGRTEASRYFPEPVRMGATVKLAPSLIRADLFNLERVFQELEAAEVDFVHIDLMDGHFAPTLGFPAELIKLAKDKTRIPLDVHLLVEEPSRYASEMPLGPSDQISFHIESAKQARLRQTIEIFRQSGARVGLALKPETPVHLLMPWLAQVDTVLLLNIPPGAHSVSPSSTAFLRLQELKTLQTSQFPNIRIEIDGGVNTETVETFARLGTDILVCGSIVFNEKSIQESVSALRKILK